MYNTGLYKWPYLSIFCVISEKTWVDLFPIHWNCYLWNSTNFNFIYKNLCLLLFHFLSIRPITEYIVVSLRKKRKWKTLRRVAIQTSQDKIQSKEDSSLLNEQVLYLPNGDPLYRFPTAIELFFLLKVIILALILNYVDS